jgi:hypothetical protein
MPAPVVLSVSAPTHEVGLTGRLSGPWQVMKQKEEEKSFAPKCCSLNEYTSTGQGLA